MSTEGLLTAEEFFNWCSLPENDDFNWELDRGRPVHVPFGSQKRGFVCANACGILGDFVYGRPYRGYLCSNNVGVVLERNPDTVLGPDVAYFHETETFDQISRFFAVKPPRLAVEVLSLEDSITRMNRRISRFLAFGVMVVWLVDPEERAVTVYRAGEPLFLLERADELTGGDVLPGFRCRVMDFFTLPGKSY
jgi:Uma2 family endonuclease